MHHHHCHKKDCCKSWRLCLTKIAGWGLILWAIGYALNGVIQAINLSEHYSTWIVAKHVMHRLGISFAAILLSGLVLHVLSEEEAYAGHGCGDHAGDDEDDKAPATTPGGEKAGSCCGGHGHGHDHGKDGGHGCC